MDTIINLEDFKRKLEAQAITSKSRTYVRLNRIRTSYCVVGVNGSLKLGTMSSKGTGIFTPVEPQEVLSGHPLLQLTRSSVYSLEYNSVESTLDIVTDDYKYLMQAMEGRESEIGTVLTDYNETFTNPNTLGVDRFSLELVHTKHEVDCIIGDLTMASRKYSRRFPYKRLRQFTPVVTRPSLEQFKKLARKIPFGLNKCIDYAEEQERALYESATEYHNAIASDPDSCLYLTYSELRKALGLPIGVKTDMIFLLQVLIGTISNKRLMVLKEPSDVLPGFLVMEQYKTLLEDYPEAKDYYVGYSLLASCIDTADRYAEARGLTRIRENKEFYNALNLDAYKAEI